MPDPVLIASAEAYWAELDNMSGEDRMDLVNGARAEVNWPSAAFLAGHARKWGRGRTPEQYAVWAQNIKARPGVEVHAYFHAVKGSRGLAFVDHREGVVVNFDVEQRLNFDCFSPATPTRPWITDRLASGLYRRYRDMEL